MKVCLIDMKVLNELARCSPMWREYREEYLRRWIAGK